MGPGARHRPEDSGRGQGPEVSSAKILNYEQPNCDNLVDAQLNELLQLAANSPDRPATYSIPSAADLQKIAQASTILTVMSDLQAGGDKAKMTWLAICGAEFPEVVGKIIDVQKSDPTVDIMVFFGATQEEVQAATTANMDVKVWTSRPPPAARRAQEIPPQPDVVRLQKDDRDSLFRDACQLRSFAIPFALGSGEG